MVCWKVKSAVQKKNMKEGKGNQTWEATEGGGGLQL
jgi:hypothetical protein